MLKADPRCHGLACEVARRAIDYMEISDSPDTKSQSQVTDRYCATGMSLFVRAVPATSPTNELYNACASSFRTKQWIGSSARPNRQTVTHSVQAFESGLVATQ
jgi:hypothetical protein